MRPKRQIFSKARNSRRFTVTQFLIKKNLKNDHFYIDNRRRHVIAQIK